MLNVPIQYYNCRGDTRPARGSKLTLLEAYASLYRFARTVVGYHPSTIQLLFHVAFGKTPRGLSSQQDCISLALRAPLRDATYERGDLSEFLAARTCASCWLDNPEIASCARQTRQRLVSRAQNAQRVALRAAGQATSGKQRLAIQLQVQLQRSLTRCVSPLTNH